MFVAEDPGFGSEDGLEICLGFFTAAEPRTGDGIHFHCSQSPMVFQAELCFVKGDGLCRRAVGLRISIKV